MNYNRYFAEFIGTFVLVLMGCGGIVVNEIFANTLGHLGICLTFGLVVMAIIYSIGNISGAHINPAVTLGFFFAGRLDKKYLLPYVVSQFIGATLAMVLLYLLFPHHNTLGATLPNIPLVSAILVEVFITFILMFVILSVSKGHKEKGTMAGVSIGGTVAFMALVAGPLTGASMNPARSLVPAFFSGMFFGKFELFDILEVTPLAYLLIYLLAPIIGVLLAIPTCKWIQGKGWGCCGEDQKENC